MNPNQIKKEPDELKQMKRRIAELEVQNEILKKGTRHTSTILRFCSSSVTICNKI